MKGKNSQGMHFRTPADERVILQKLGLPVMHDLRFIFPRDVQEEKGGSWEHVPGRKDMGVISNGCGRWGTVYLAWDCRAEKYVAVKILNPIPDARDRAKEREWDEYTLQLKETATSFEQFKYVICPPPAQTVDGTRFVIMKWFPTFLHSYLRDSLPIADRYVAEAPLLSLEQRLSIFGTLVKGVQEFHSLGFVHQDLKPDNIAVFLDESGKTLQAIICDLGVSSYAFPELQTTKNTGHFGLVYTRSPGMAIHNVRPRPSMDVFSLGALGYRLFTGEYPFEREMFAHRPGASQKSLETAFDEVMRPFVSSTNIDGTEKFDYSLNKEELSSRLEDKVTTARIPKHLRRFIKDCLLEKYANGSEACEGLENERTIAKKKKSFLMVGAALALVSLITGTAVQVCHTPVRSPTIFETEYDSAKRFTLRSEAVYDTASALFRFGVSDILLHREYNTFPEHEELSELLRTVPERTRIVILDEVRNRAQTRSKVDEREVCNQMVSPPEQPLNRVPPAPDDHYLLVSTAISDAGAMRVAELTMSLREKYFELLNARAHFPESKVSPKFYKSFVDALSEKISHQGSRKTFVDTLLMELLNNGGIYNINILPVEYESRYASLNTGESGIGVTPLHKVQVLLAESLNNNLQPSRIVDLEDALTEWIVGRDVLQRAKEFSGSGEYRFYMNARDATGQFVIPLASQNVLHTLLDHLFWASKNLLNLESEGKSLSPYTIPRTPEAETYCSDSYSIVASKEYSVRTLQYELLTIDGMLRQDITEQQKKDLLHKRLDHEERLRAIYEMAQDSSDIVLPLVGSPGEQYTPEKKKFIDRWREEKFREFDAREEKLLEEAHDEDE